jgi:integrase
MARLIKRADNTRDYHTSVFLHKNGTYYCRIIHNESLAVIATRSTGEQKEEKARVVAGSLLSTLPLQELYKDYLEKQKEKANKPLQPQVVDNRPYSRIALKEMNVADYFVAFWDKERGPYILDRVTMGKPLSAKHLKESSRIARDIIGRDSILKTIPIRDIDYTDIEEFFRRISKSYTPFTLKHVRETLSKGVTWGSERQICKVTILKDLPIPKTNGRERGILYQDEVDKILALETIPLWYTVEGTPRLTAKALGVKGGTRKGVYLREKLYVVLGLFTGARRGEIRALRWEDIDFNKKTIKIIQNFVEEDGIKDPKANSKREVPLAEPLEKILLEAYEVAKIIGEDKPTSYVILNPRSLSKPCTDSIDDAWPRVLEAIGISKEEKESRHLVFHGTRHRLATILLNGGLSLNEVGKFTGHRVTTMTAHYGDHSTPESREKAKGILNQKT